MALRKILSGGQTGVDRGALDACIATGTPYGGWCPKGGRAEDRPEPPGLLADYPHLTETPSPDPLQRTEWNVRDSDAVLVLLDRRGIAVSPGTAHAKELARQYGRPCLCVRVDLPDDLARARSWLCGLPAAGVLNVAGPRASEAHGIQEAAKRFIIALLRQAP